jgi:hypothetical protein
LTPWIVSSWTLRGTCPFILRILTLIGFFRGQNSIGQWEGEAAFD